MAFVLEDGWVAAQRKRGAVDRGWFPNLRPDIFARGHRLVSCNSTVQAFYAAVQDVSTGQVRGVVIEKSWQRSDAGNFAYRVLDEATAGRLDDAARRVLDALSPTDDPSAVEWRARVAANLAQIESRARALERAASSLIERRADDPEGARHELEHIRKRQRQQADLLASDDTHEWRPE